MDSDFLLEKRKTSPIHLELKSPSERKKALDDSNGDVLTPPSSELKHSHESISFDETTNNLNGYINNLLIEREELCKNGKSSFKNTLLIVDREIEKMASLVAIERKEFGDSLYYRRQAREDLTEETYITISQAVRIPVDEYPNYNFIGRILGPRGMTAKQLERQTECKIMIRGRYSNKMYGYVAKGNARRGDERTQNEDELPLRVVIESTGPRKVAEQRVEHAVKVLKSLLVPPSDGLDVLKQRQLVELAIMNGTYRPQSNWHNSNYNSSSPLTDLASFSMVDYPEQQKERKHSPEDTYQKWSPDVTQAFNEQTVNLISQMFEQNSMASQRVSMGDCNNSMNNMSAAQLDFFIDFLQGKSKRDETVDTSSNVFDQTAAQLLYNLPNFTNHSH